LALDLHGLPDLNHADLAIAGWLMTATGVTAFGATDTVAVAYSVEPLLTWSNLIEPDAGYFDCCGRGHP
jgi:hypothetical protein